MKGNAPDAARSRRRHQGDPRNLVGRGFNVKIPQKLIKPVRLPAGLKQSLEIQGLQLALNVKPTGLLVAGDRLWYGADIVLEPAKKAAKPAAKP